MDQYQSADFKTFIRILDEFANDMAQDIYGARSEAFDRLPAGIDKRNLYNRPVALTPETLKSYVNNLRKLNDKLQTNPKIAEDIKNSTNAQIVKRYYEKIVSNLPNIDYGQTPFKKDISAEFNRFNSIVFNVSNKFKYPDPLDKLVPNKPEQFIYPGSDRPEGETAGQFTHPEQGLETSHASSLKQKATMAAGALRGVIDKLTNPNPNEEPSLPQQHPGWDRESSQGRYIPSQEEWSKGYRDPVTGRWVPGSQ